jgi:hypothetical protein
MSSSVRCRTPTTVASVISSLLFSSFFYISFLIVDGISCVRGDRGARGSPHYGRCLPGLLGVALGPREDQL